MMPRILIWVFFWFALVMRTPPRLLTVCNFWIENCLPPIRTTFCLDWVGLIFDFDYYHDRHNFKVVLL
jgi:hypothetical protein